MSWVQARVKERRRNPVTHVMEPYIPWSIKLARLIGSAATVAFFLCLVIAFVFGIIVYRIVVVHLMLSSQWETAVANYATSFTAALINLVIILLLNRVYNVARPFLPPPFLTSPRAIGVPGLPPDDMGVPADGHRV